MLPNVTAVFRRSAFEYTVKTGLVSDGTVYSVRIGRVILILFRGTGSFHTPSVGDMKQLPFH